MKPRPQLLPSKLDQKKIISLGEEIFSRYLADEHRLDQKVLDMAMASHLVLLKELRKAVS